MTNLKSVAKVGVIMCGKYEGNGKETGEKGEAPKYKLANLKRGGVACRGVSHRVAVGSKCQQPQ